MIDNYDLWEAHDREQAEELEKLPVCDCCGERIQDEYYYEIDGEILCEECLKDRYRRDTEDYER